MPAEKSGRNPRTGQPITYTAYLNAKSAPAEGEAMLRDEIAVAAQIDQAAAGRAVHQIGRQRGKMLLTQESAWI